MSDIKVNTNEQDINVTNTDQTIYINNEEVIINVKDVSQNINVTTEEVSMTFEMGGSNHGQIKVSGTDTTLDFLYNKLVAGTAITFTKDNDGANESLIISSESDTFWNKSGSTLTPSFFGDSVRMEGNLYAGGTARIGTTSINGNLFVSGTAHIAGSAKIGGALDMSTNLISNVIDPSSNQDAATKKYVDDNITAEDLDFSGDTGNGAVDLDSQTFTISGTTNEIETSGSNQTLTIGIVTSPTLDATNITGVPAASILAGTFGTGSYTIDTQLTVGTLTDGTASLIGGSLTSVKLGTLTDNGFVKTSSGDGTLSVDTNTYLTSVAHTDLTDMPSAIVTDHDGRYYTETEIGATTSPSGASLVGIEDSGTYFTGTEVETALQEVGDKFNTMNEPTGFPNRTDSELSFDSGTRVFTISPTNTSFDIWQVGVKTSIGVQLQINVNYVTIPDSSGLHAIYYDSGVLSQILNPSDAEYADLMINKVLVALIYWNETDNAAYILAEERHGLIMDGKTHEWMHFTIGAAYREGFTVSDYVEATDTDAALTFKVEDGIFFDEDLDFNINDGTPATKYEQQLNGADAELPILYRDDTDGSWKEDAATTLPYKSLGAGRLAYNKDDGDGTFSQVEVTDGKWVSMTIIATNDWQYPIKAIQGQNEYTDKKTAIEEATNEIIAFGDFPTPETTIIYRFVMETKDSFSGTKKAKIADVTDFRLSGITGASAAAQNHGTLSGLSDDDHAQYLLVDGTRAMTGDLDMDTNKVLFGDNNDASIYYAGDIYDGFYLNFDSREAGARGADFGFLNGAIRGIDGAYNHPTFGFISDPLTGIYLHDTYTLGFVCGETVQLLLSSTQADFRNNNITTTGTLHSDGNITTNGLVDGIDIATDVAANTLKDTDVNHNVTTNLSLGAINATTMVVASSDGTDATLIEADTDDAGLLGANKWDEIVANTLKKTSMWETDGTETQLITADEIDMQSKKIINVTDCTANQDVSTKKYVDDNDFWDRTGTVLSSKTNGDEVDLTNALGEAFEMVKVDADGLTTFKDNVYSAGDFGNCLSFDGDNEFVNYADDTAQITSRPITLSLWFNADNYDDDFTEFFSDTLLASFGVGYYIGTDNANNLRFFVEGWNSNFATTPEPSAGEWHHVVGRWKADGTVEIWLDNVKGAVTDSYTGSVTGTNIVRTGRGFSGANFDGKIDEIALWSSELADSDIADLYNNGAGIRIDKDDSFATSDTSMGTNLEALFHFDATSGSTAVDSSVNSNTGTLNNMEDADWVEGIVPTVLPAAKEIIVLQSRDGMATGEYGTVELGDDDVRTIINGQTIRFNIDGTEKYIIDTAGLLTGDGSGLTDMHPSFGAYKTTSSQSIAGAWEKITITAEEFDTGGDYDAPNSKFIAPADGKYFFSLTASLLTLGDGKTMGLALYKNGALFKSFQQFPIGASATTVMGGNVVVELDEDDYIEGWIYHNNGAALNCYFGTAYTYFSGYRVS